MKKLMVLLVMALLCLNVQAQIVIEGKVTDKDGAVLIGASVLEKGTSNVVATDVNGAFSITLQDSLAILVIHYTGYDTEEVGLNDIKKPLQITLTGINLLDLKVEIIAHEVPLVEADNTTQGQTVISEQIRNLQKRTTKQKISSTTRRFSTNEGNSIYARGSRDNSTDFYVAGVRKKGKRSKKNPASSSLHPRVHHTEDYHRINENRFYTVQKEPQSTFSIDVDAAAYSNMRRFLQNGQLPPKDAVRIEELINYFNYDYPEPQDEHPFAVIIEVSDCPWETDHRLLHIGLQGKKIVTDHLPASNLVFLIDVSGSMQAKNKLPLLKSSFELLLDQLRPDDRVAIVTYAGSSGLVLPSTSGKEKEKMLTAINHLRAGGSTAGAAGIQLAYQVAIENFIEGANNRVILATDGDFNVGMSSDAELVRLIEEKRESGVFLTVLGYGMGNYKDNKMQQLASKGNGNHAYIDDVIEAQKVLVNEFGGTMFTIAKDVKIQIEFNPKQVAGYRLIGYENRLLENEDFEDDTKDAGELGAGHTVTALYEIIPTGVKSKHLGKDTELKYQKIKTKPNKKYDNELSTVALRYKAPDGKKSKLITAVALDSNNALANTSNNFRFSVAVAEFGMLLRDSEYKADANYEQVLELAKQSKGLDPNAYRAQFIDLVKQAQALANRAVAESK
ncbi:MAG: von Willebrand factor type A domain-containing protein [Bacteroidota bacterium]